MKSTTTILKKTMKCSLFVIILLLATQVVAQKTVSSTSSGGDWSAGSTWQGGIIPANSDYVVINGPVYLDGGKSCGNITINSSGSVYNKYAWNPTLTVAGNFINNGIVSTNPGGYSFYLDIKGNIENNGIWTINGTTLSGVGNQTIKQSVGKRFEGRFDASKSGGDILLGSNVHFYANYWNLKQSRILTNGYVLTTTDYHLDNGKIFSNDQMSLSNTLLSDMVFDGNYKLIGLIRIRTGVEFKGIATNNDIIQNEYAWNPSLEITGKIINNGSIRSNPSGYSFTLNTYGDIENNGAWAPNRTNFKSSGIQVLKQSANKFFNGVFVNYEETGSIQLRSDIAFQACEWDINQSTVRTNGFDLYARDCFVFDGKIQSNDSLFFKNTTIEDLVFSGDYKLTGKTHLRYGVVFDGVATILDTLQNLYAWNPNVTIKGNIINKGAIIRNPSGYDLKLDVYGNVDNRGVWSPTRTNFLREGEQLIQQAENTFFTGYMVNLSDKNTLKLVSDVTFKANSWDLDKATIQTNNHNLTIIDGVFYDGKVYSNNKLNMQNAIIEDLSLYGTYTLKGKVNVMYGVVLNGTATIEDTLQNRYAWNPNIVVQGKIINNGFVTSNPGGYSLTIDLFGDIENNKIWSPTRTNFNKAGVQEIKQAENVFFTGTFVNTDSLNQINLGSEVVFRKNEWDLNQATIFTNGNNFNIEESTLYDGKINSADSLIFKNSLIENLSFSGDYKLVGKTDVIYGNVFNGVATIVDTLQNRYGWNPNIVVKGKIINKGAIITNPGGYSLTVDLYGDVDNQGVWSPYRTNFKQAGIQELKQQNGKYFATYVVQTDTLNKVKFASNITLQSNEWDLDQATILTNGYHLRLNQCAIYDGKIQSNDTLIFKETRCNDLVFSGNVKFAGLADFRYGNVFNNVLTVVDTIQNQYGWNPNFTIKGKLINNGVIRNNPSGYSFNLDAYGDIENNGQLSVRNLYLLGKQERNISGRNANAITATVYIDDAIKLNGNSIVPNINFTSKPEAGCLVQAGASLSLNGDVNASKLKNDGRVGVTQLIENTWTQTFNFYNASIRLVGNPPIGKMTIDHFGNQQHHAAKQAVNCWWRLRSSPAMIADSMEWLKLNYTDNMLNGNLEDSLKVFFSPNAGLSWKHIKEKVSIDKVNNLVTIERAPYSGHYLLAASALGITSFEPLVETAEPTYGGNTGQLTMYLFGAGFTEKTTVKLVAKGFPEIACEDARLTDGFGEAMLAEFNLKNKSVGVYDVVVETPGKTPIVLTKYFTVLKGERSNPWSSLAGRDRFLLNRWSTFTLNYGNTANTDAIGNILVYVVNDFPGLEVEFPDVKLVYPKELADMGPAYTRIRDSVSIYYLSDSLSGYENQKMRIYPFYIPVIGAGSSNSVRVRVKLSGTGSLNMDSWLLDPLWELPDYTLKSAEPMPNEVRLCITAAAMRAWANGAMGLANAVVPGMACFSVIDKTLQPIKYITPEDMRPEEDNSWGSWIWWGASVMTSAVQCGASFVPGLGTGVSLGIEMVNMMVDMKDGYDAKEGCWRKFRKKSQSKLNSNGVTSFDPNEKVGPSGFTAQNYISKEGSLNYTIFYENKATAGASALEVFITDTLDVAKFDLSTFSFHTIAFGEQAAKIQEHAKEFQLLLDLYPQKDIFLQVYGKIDTLTGIVNWSFHSIDRLTMELTEDPDMGFLPPNKVSPEGEGHVTFSCKLKSTVMHDDEIANRASIVFDFNKPILTNTFKNKIDTKIPVSSVAPLAAKQTKNKFTISWSGSDLGSQISAYNIFVSENDSAYVLWKVASAPGSEEFIGKNGSRYKFYSLATDSIGFTEPQKTKAEAVSSIETGVDEMNDISEYFTMYPNPTSDKCMVDFDLSVADEVMVVVEDMFGRSWTKQERKAYSVGKHQLLLDLHDFANGMYIVSVTIGNKSYHNKLMVKRK